MKNLAQQPHASVPQASGDWANTKATYNFWKSSRIEAEDIIEAHQKQTSQREQVTFDRTKELTVR